jgi:hypothetical protein
MDEVGLGGPVPNPRWWWQSLTANELINIVPLSQKMSQKVAGAAVRESGSGAIPK